MLRRIRKNTAIHKIYRDLVNNHGELFELKINGNYIDDYVPFKDIDIRRDDIEILYSPSSLTKAGKQVQRKNILRKAKSMGLSTRETSAGNIIINSN